MRPSELLRWQNPERVVPIRTTVFESEVGEEGFVVYQPPEFEESVNTIIAKACYQERLAFDEREEHVLGFPCEIARRKKL